MANILRKTRQQLYMNDKFSKYLVYAIGEIFLVVVGILIALQVNNLNEQSKADAKEFKYLISMKSELSTNLELIHSEIGSLERSIDSQREIIALINTDEDTVKEMYIAQLLAKSFSRVFELKYRDGTFKELLYSGELILIKNDSIKNEVTSWDGRMIAVRKQEQGVYDAREKITHFMIDRGIFKMMLDDVSFSDRLQIKKSINRTSSKRLLSSQKFENLISYHIALNLSQKAFYKKLEDNLENLLRMVTAELEA